MEIVFVEFGYTSFLQLNMKVNNNDKQFPAYTRTLGYGKLVKYYHQLQSWPKIWKQASLKRNAAYFSDCLR